MGTGNSILFLSITSLGESKDMLAPISDFPPFGLYMTSPILVDYSAASSDYSPEGVRVVTKNTSFTPDL